MTQTKAKRTAPNLFLREQRSSAVAAATTTYIVWGGEKINWLSTGEITIQLALELHTYANLRCWHRGGRTFFLVVTEDALPEVRDHHRQTLTKGYLRFPAEEIFCLGNIRFSLVRVIFCVRPEFYPCIWVNGFLDHLNKQMGTSKFAGNRSMWLITLHSPSFLFFLGGTTVR